ncbi:Uncharacterized protein TCM_007142 [Theobroma cacao]|uniref:Uncharacterized protein n=1 Tax=Theobroma cacao TaxID=3641 RepID=A0A061E005_THECC|nr:Uncharacterized protein TCM_007142 [Theobroma cacao]
MAIRMDIKEWDPQTLKHATNHDSLSMNISNILVLSNNFARWPPVSLSQSHCLRHTRNFRVADVFNHLSVLELQSA